MPVKTNNLGKSFFLLSLFNQSNNTLEQTSLSKVIAKDQLKNIGNKLAQELAKVQAESKNSLTEKVREIIKEQFKLKLRVDILENLVNRIISLTLSGVVHKIGLHSDGLQAFISNLTEKTQTVFNRALGDNVGIYGLHIEEPKSTSLALVLVDLGNGTFWLPTLMDDGCELDDGTKLQYGDIETILKKFQERLIQGWDSTWKDPHAEVTGPQGGKFIIGQVLHQEREAGSPLNNPIVLQNKYSVGPTDAA